MLEQFVFVARSSLAYPDMMCAISEREIFLKLCFLLQMFHSRTEFSFIARKKNRVHDSEINLRRFIAIGTKAVFDYYFHILVLIAYFDNDLNSTVQHRAQCRFVNGVILANLPVLFDKVPFENIREVKMITV